MKKTMIISAVLALLAIPVLAEAGPSVGIDYTNVGISGHHAGRPGGSLSLGNIFRGGVVAEGSATAARGFDQIDVSVGKLIPAAGLSFEPYMSLNFLNVNYSNPVNSVKDFYGLAGVNVSLPLSREVALGIGGGYGHTISAYGSESGGSVYTGDAIASFRVAPRVTTDLQVQYQHVPGVSMTDYSAGLNYHF